MQTEYPHTTPWQHSQQYPVMPPQSPTPQPGVVWLPPVANDRSWFGIGGGLIVFIALLDVFQNIRFYLSNTQPVFTKLAMLLFALLLPTLLLGNGIRVFAYIRGWHAINLRRQWAAYTSAAGVPLAEPQPFPNIEALPLPDKLKLKRNWLAVFVWFCLIMVMLSSSQGTSYLDSQIEITRWLALILPLLLLCTVIFAGMMVWASVPPSIRVTPEGLAIRHPADVLSNIFGSARKQMIPWSDARLFAIREGKPGASTICYELSSPFKVVPFSRIVRPRWWALYRPAQPLGEYNAQMDALLALISARTGLPLYDVR